MIQVTDLQGKERYVNVDLIEYVEANPETQIVLTNGHRFYVKESPADVAERVKTYRRECIEPSPPAEEAE